MPGAETPILRARSRHDASVLASGYTRTQHVMNVIGLGAFAASALWVGEHVFMHDVGAVELTLGLLIGWVLTDFICGFIHWAGDTWGRTDMPVLGRMFVRSFREHHVDPRAITRHGTVQLLGEQSMVAAPLLPVLLFFETEDALGVTALVCAYTTFVGAMCANVFHKWAHMTRPRLIARAMQRAGLIISYRQHAKHHRPPYVENYCIAIGWLNPLLESVRFWRGLEWLIYKLTGAVPREDDLGREAALALMRARD